MNFLIKLKPRDEKMISIDNTLFDQYSLELSKNKNLIDNYVKEWEIIKKINHQYEYIYTSPNIKHNITSFIPVSRSYFKLKEILQDQQIITNETKNLAIFCIAEAPGGFIQSLIEYRKNIKSIGATTLLSNNKKIPYWNKLIRNDKLIQFFYGSENDGNICSFHNIISILKSVGNHSIDIITGDGGFDNSDDYNQQELNSLCLIYSEIFMALNLQKKGGTFICKLFDLFLKETIQLLYILFLSYEEIILNKPCLSRMSNSEKYIVCKNFKGYNQSLVNTLCRSFQTKDLNIQISSEFCEKIKEFNIIYTNNQINHIQRGLKLIESKEFKRFPSKQQIKSSIEWCKKYNLPINEKNYYLNYFLNRNRTITR